MADSFHISVCSTSDDVSITANTFLLPFLMLSKMLGYILQKITNMNLFFIWYILEILSSDFFLWYIFVFQLKYSKFKDDTISCSLTDDLWQNTGP